jgi:hypothetical protein
MDKMNNVSEPAHLKKRARSIQSRFKEFGIDIKLGHALEAQAIAMGYPNWATLTGMVVRDTTQQIDVGNIVVEAVQARTRELYLDNAKDTSIEDILAYTRHIAYEEMGKIQQPFSLIVPAFGYTESPDVFAPDTLADELRNVLQKYCSRVGVTTLAELIVQSLPENAEYAVARVYNHLVKANLHNAALGPLQKARLLTEQLAEAGAPGSPEFTRIAIVYGREMPSQVRKFWLNSILVWAAHLAASAVSFPSRASLPPLV